MERPNLSGLSKRVIGEWRRLKPSRHTYKRQHFLPHFMFFLISKLHPKLTASICTDHTVITHQRAIGLAVVTSQRTTRVSGNTYEHFLSGISLV